VVERVVAANPDLAEKFRGGKRGVLGALVGQVMCDRGRANPSWSATCWRGNRRVA
jgi:Asp-tRNA(Asn)/Glu-tRNA(Gln) amidotransferase B subunit